MTRCPMTRYNDEFGDPYRTAPGDDLPPLTRRTALTLFGLWLAAWGLIVGAILVTVRACS